jgi:hypothetical protein
MGEKDVEILQQADASRDISSPKKPNGADVFDYCLYTWWLPLPLFIRA